MKGNMYLYFYSQLNANSFIASNCKTKKNNIEILFDDPISVLGCGLVLFSV